MSKDTSPHDLQTAAAPVGTTPSYMPGFGNDFETEAHLQDDYIDCWADIKKKFDGTPGKK